MIQSISEITMRDWKKMCLFEMMELLQKNTPVCEDVYIRLASDAKEREIRESLVKEYGGYSNITFYSDGTIFKDHPGAIGWLRTLMPQNAPPEAREECVK